MRKILALIVAATVVGAAGSALAVPTAFYNPGTGGIYMKNDTGAALGAFAVISAGSNVKTDGGLFAPVGGAQFDPGDLPGGFTYLTFPATNTEFGLSIGNVITPGTPVSDLSSIYYVNLSTGVQSQGLVVEIPEPATIAMGGLGLIGVVAAARRRKA